jgi:hypothetical protein
MGNVDSRHKELELWLGSHNSSVIIEEKDSLRRFIGAVVKTFFRRKYGCSYDGYYQGV